MYVAMHGYIYTINIILIIYHTLSYIIVLYSLHTHRSDSGTEPRPASVVLSSQVTDISGNVPKGDPVTLAFEYSTVSVIK